jgi:sulfur-oxidizing protein SoxB
VRVGGLQYTCDPAAAMGARISSLTLNGTPLSADKRYKVAGWAPVSEEARLAGGEPIWALMARYLRGQKTIPQRKLNVPRLVGVAGNPGLA